MLAIFKREFKSYFQNVIGWLFVAALLAVYGLYFYVYNLKNGYPYIAAKSVLKSNPAAKASAIVPEKSFVPLKSVYSSVDA